MTVAHVTYLIILAVCILASGFFSGSETALIAVPRERVAQLEGFRRAETLAALKDDPDQMLSTLLIANNFVNILGASVATVLFVDLLGSEWGPWVATVVVTSVVLVIGEITPKSIATRYPERFSLAVAPTILRISRMLRPVSRGFLWFTRGLFRLFRLDITAGPAPITEDDIRTMASLGEASGDIEATEREIIHSLFRTADRQTRDVMTPRTDIVMLTLPVTMRDVEAAVAARGHSRYPVVDGSLDQLVGVLHVKDLLRMGGQPGSEDVRRLVREPHFVPESKLLLELLQEMRARRRGLVFVLDEHGGVEGIVTIKDVVSELVGDLQDEHDPGAPTVVAMPNGTWMADGRISIDDLADALGTEIREGPYSTLAGLVLDLAGKIPASGDVVTLDEHRLTVTQMDRHRVDQVRIEADPPIS
ncbi:HlyC/CorC family transporter [bacterium]|nr:HlyC/CorC family transporter [bacterium]